VVLEVQDPDTRLVALDSAFTDIIMSLSGSLVNSMTLRQHGPDKGMGFMNIKDFVGFGKQKV
jgi:hypothetical protein